MPEPDASLFARARARAGGLGHRWIDVEHGVQRRLEATGVDRAGLAAALQASLPPRGNEPVEAEGLPLAPAVKRLLEATAARLESRRDAPATALDLLAAALGVEGVAHLLVGHGVGADALEG